MRLRGELGDVGARWLERFAPVFERMGAEVTVLATPRTVALLQSARVGRGAEAHADLRVDEVFERVKITSANDDKIAVRMEPGALTRALRGMIALEATRMEARLVKRTAVEGGRAMPYLNFTAVDGRAEVSHDVPIVGPLNRAEVAACERVLEANVVDVGYWLECDRFALESVREAVERFARVSDFVEVTTTKSGSLYISASNGSVRMLGMEYRGLRVLPAEADEYDERASEAGGVAARMAEIRSSGIGSTVLLSVKHLQRGFLACASNPSTLLVGIAESANFFELVFRYGAQTERDGDSVGFMVRIPVVDDTDTMN